MKRYVKSGKYVKATSENYDLVHKKISDIFREVADERLDLEPEFTAQQLADYIADYMDVFMTRDEWYDLAFDWIQMNLD